MIMGWNIKRHKFKICPICKKTFKVFFCQEKLGKGIYCSKECVWKSPERKKKISEKMKIIMIGNKHSLGCKRTLKEIERIRKMHIGKHRSEETKEKMREAKKRFWNKRGRQPKRDSYHIYDSKYTEWRMKVFSRDDWTCQTCKTTGGILNAHHIKSWKNYPELRYSINNGITLCKKCHKLFHKKYDK